FAGGGGDGDVAAEADDVVETQLFGQRPVELLVAEAAVGDHAHLDVGRQQFGQPDQQAMLVEAAVVLERALVDPRVKPGDQPYQGCGTTPRVKPGGRLRSVISDSMMVACLSASPGSSPWAGSVGPIQRYHDGSSCADDVGHPAGEDIVDLDVRVGEQAIDLFGGMLGVQATGGGQALADHGVEGPSVRKRTVRNVNIGLIGAIRA